MTNDQFSLENKTVLITGAGGKLAQTFIKVLLSKGARVIGMDIQDNPNLYKDIVDKNNSKFKYIKSDITNRDQLREIKEELTILNFMPNVIVNNAAAGQVTFIDGNLVDFTKFPVEVWDQNLNVNLTGTLNICQIFGSYLEEQKNGSIVNISSTYGFLGCDQSVYGDSGLNSSIAYAATKAGVIGMTKYLAAYWGKSNIRVNAIAPAGIYNDHKDPFYSNYVKKIMLGKMGAPEDIANAIVYLSSEASKWVTGTILSVDGGYSAW